jgi:hypothetical protein
MLLLLAMLRTLMLPILAYVAAAGIVAYADAAHSCIC